ncbi:metal ABC transporter substrate-binding protein [Georgenia sp. M64]|uniref:metal ABC transporter substrate-binding protein n=1 Tax=Georgenia sp. M64 TaxID=3120520 RepID=UPI0030DE9AC7
MTRRTLRTAAAATVLATTLAACSGTGSGDGGAGSPDGAGAEVLASFYPLQYVAERVGGDRVQVDSLTPPGAEPHDLELAPADVARLGEASVVVYLSGFQPAVDDAVAQTSPEHLVDAAAHAERAGTDDHADEESAEADDHSAETDDHAAEDEHAGEAGADPHLWLDPTLLAEVAVDVADELAAADPDNAQEYEANAETLAGELTALDEEFTTGLAQCEIRTVVVAHEAYGYLAEAYDFEQVGISGIDPDTEPSPARLAEIGDVVRAEGVTTIFTESLVNPKVAETLADDLGVETAVLDPLEGLADDSKDYQVVMRENLAALREALACA